MWQPFCYPITSHPNGPWRNVSLTSRFGWLLRLSGEKLLFGDILVPYGGIVRDDDTEEKERWMTHWREEVERPTPEMVVWRRVVLMLSGLLIGTGLALLVWGLR